MNKFDCFGDSVLADHFWSAYVTIISNFWICSLFPYPRCIQIKLDLFCVSKPDVFTRTYLLQSGLRFDFFYSALLLGQVPRPSIFDLRKSIEFVLFGV